MQNGTLLAAVDLGSNSFRLEIGRVDHGQIHRTEYLKETVRQGNGLDSARNLTPEAMQRGWDALARFGERLAGFKRSQVRAVATQTLREARNRDEFLLRARTVLGFGIDVIPGREEARLIYQGVAHMLPHNEASDRERRLVVDIGGRSTEMIIGHALTAQVMESYRVGSVAWSMKHFPQGQFTPSAFRSAEIAAKAVLDDALGTYSSDQWDVAYGASGTIGAVSDVLVASGAPVGVVTREGLDWLLERLLKAGSVDKLRIDGMREDRKAVIGGGVSVLRAVFDLLDIREMKVAQGALRHGVLYELLERDDSVADLRAATVARLAARFEVDAAQAQRVSQCAAALYLQIDPSARDASNASRSGRALRKLGWAAQLHEIGAHISHSDYHKHGAYILDNADAPGFATNELHQLSQLVLGHRGKLRKLEAALEDEVMVAQLLALRLAVILCHARRDPDPQALKVAASGRVFTLSCNKGWPEAYPQSAHLLREEMLAWQKTNWRVELPAGF
ncbi:Ppx/GppA phosphatase family protein [Variovorax ginsengisoli]|uniref:Exopolyphosphatase/guanosine-5'-triphosphate, 3'-diphosphate pyrophosphatase n=1 Tax=Variovorax ginsengisoli TaxID=363844 RepID=A0ABT9S469_9BURK|nr:Ppx/GppA phosphatase family protein [Variovorax ginsengisoli]MDP9899139.1 exopolyphosphatase/guanosine-5'-triphosphate,3'-diphosphate pyrophosphatase [Variovorax ginsengisoli]